MTLNALMDIEDSPLNGSFVTHWMPLPSAPKFADILRGAPGAPKGGDKHE